MLDRETLDALLGDLVNEMNQMTAERSTPMLAWELAHALAELAAKSRARSTLPWTVAASLTAS